MPRRRIINPLPGNKQIRVAERSQFEALAELHGNEFAVGWSADEIEDLDASDSVVTLVSTNGAAKQICGFAIIRTVVDEGEILTIMVAPDYRRQGLGRQLLEEIRRHMEVKNVLTLFLEVAKQNEAGIALYRQHGFCEAGVRKNYVRLKNGGTDDALLMRLDLAQ